jgi:predicted RNA binding protein YcfA (HicA-like mRNA interferase family)
MPTLPTLTFTQLCRIIEKMGFYKTRQKGSHIRYEHKDGRKTTVPNHGHQDVPKGLLIKIIKQDLALSVDDFMRFM